jgi:DNA polymerase III sliding clamp (beta) subunit (PCNA family)
LGEREPVSLSAGSGAKTKAKTTADSFAEKQPDEPFVVTLDYQFVIEYLKKSTDIETVYFCANGSDGPVLMRSTQADRAGHVLMPLSRDR